jgi:hypothetical protein
MFNFIEIEFKNELASYAIRISPVFFEQRSSSINSHGSKTSAERIETSVTGNQAILPSASEKSERSRGDGASFPQFIFWVFQKVKKKKNGKKSDMGFDVILVFFAARLVIKSIFLISLC